MRGLKTYKIVVTHTGQQKFDEYQASLDFLFWQNVRLIRAFPFLLDSANKVKYVRESYDEWVNILVLWYIGHGDCEDIACAIAAILYCLGVLDARPLLIPQSEIDFHIVVVFKDSGATYDPSVFMGMI